MPPRRFRVATLNLLNNPHGRWPDREALVVDQARELDADVYAFQEVDAGSDQIARIVQALGSHYRDVACPNPAPESIKSLALVTRLPVVGDDRCTLAEGDIALRVALDLDGVTLHVVTTHFHFSPTKEGSARRLAQAERLLEWLSPISPPAVLAGDFNASPSGAAITKLNERFRSAQHVANGEEQPTHPTPLVHALDAEKAFGIPVFPEGEGATIDFVFVDDGIEVESCRVAWDRPAAGDDHLYPSDHFGLVADLRLP